MLLNNKCVAALQTCVFFLPRLEIGLVFIMLIIAILKLIVDKLLIYIL